MAERIRIGVLVAAVVLAVSACVPPSRPFVTPTFANVTVTPNQTFGQAVDFEGNTVTLKLDVVEPAGDTSRNRPAVVLVHSGGFVGGTRQELRYLADDLAKRGFVTVLIDYRLRPGEFFSFANPTPEAYAAITDARHDAQTAVRAVKANAATFRIDPTRVSIAGYSAGAITALGVAYRSDDPGAGGWNDQSSRVCTAVSIAGMAAEGGIDASDPKVTLLHGTADDIVPYALAQQTAVAASAVGRPANLVSYPSAGHMVIIDPRASRYREDAAEALAAAATAGPCS